MTAPALDLPALLAALRARQPADQTFAGRRLAPAPTIGAAPGPMADQARASEAEGRRRDLRREVVSNLPGGMEASALGDILSSLSQKDLTGAGLSAAMALPLLAGAPRAPRVSFKEASGEAFQRAVAKFAEARPSEAGFLTHRTPEQMREEGMRMFLSPDERTGFAVAPDGDIRNVFNHGAKGRGSAAVIEAVTKQGGTKLDNFDTGLTKVYRRLGFEETGRMPWDDQYAPTGWDYGKYGRPDVIFQEYKGGVRTPAQMWADAHAPETTPDVPAVITSHPRVRALVDALTEDERAHLARSKARQADFEKAAEILPSADTYAAGALAGEAKRGWYWASHRALLDLFGPTDAPRFAALLAATSPQTSVEENLRTALHTWSNWAAAGRPTDPRGILEALKASQKAGKPLPAWVPNTVRALASPDLSSMMLSGPKVDSFWQNLVGNLDRVTLDTWMAKSANMAQAHLGGDAVGPKGMKIGTASGPYLAFSGRIRQATDPLQALTGTPWTPAEVQETVWSFLKGASDRAMRGKSQSQKPSLPELQDAAANITPTILQQTPDFATLLNQRHGPVITNLGLTLPHPHTSPIMSGVTPDPRAIARLLENLHQYDQGKFLLGAGGLGAWLGYSGSPMTPPDSQ